MRLRLLVVGCVLAVAPFVAVPSVEAGGGCHDGQTEGAGDTVEMRNRCFSPSLLHAEPGTTVTFVNKDNLLHALSGAGLGSYDEVDVDASVQHTFGAPGVYTFMCHIHPGMSGAIVVGEQPVLASAERPEEGGTPWPLIALAAGVGLAAAFLAGKRYAGQT